MFLFQDSFYVPSAWTEVHFVWGKVNRTIFRMMCFSVLKQHYSGLYPPPFRLRKDVSLRAEYGNKSRPILKPGWLRVVCRESFPGWWKSNIPTVIRVCLLHWLQGSFGFFLNLSSSWLFWFCVGVCFLQWWYGSLLWKVDLFTIVERLENEWIS